jgi:hypothetical protein
MSKPLASSERILESLSGGVYVCEVERRITLAATGQSKKLR